MGAERGAVAAGRDGCSCAATTGCGAGGRQAAPAAADGARATPCGRGPPRPTRAGRAGRARPRASRSGPGTARRRRCRRAARTRRRRRARSPARTRCGGRSGAARARRSGRRTPRTATVRPPWACSPIHEVSRRPRCSSWTTASASSSGRTLRSASRSVPLAAAGPCRPRRRRSPAGPGSRAGAGAPRPTRPRRPRPRARRRCPGRGGRAARLSSRIVARDCQGCSSRRTISSPVRAELRPVHAAQVVALAVVAHGDVLGRAHREGARPVVARAGPAAAERDRRQRRRCAG